MSQNWEGEELSDMVFQPFPPVTSEQVLAAFDSISPEILAYGPIRFIALRESLTGRQVIVYQNFCGEAAAQYLDFLLGIYDAHEDAHEALTEVIVIDLCEPSYPREHRPPAVEHIYEEFPTLKWFGAVERPRLAHP